MRAVKSIIKKKPSVEDIVVKGKKQVKKRVNSTFGFTLTDVYALLKSCLTQTLTDEEIYELARTINDKDVIIAELEEQLKESHKKSSDLESDLKTVTEMLSQNWRIIQWKEETNSFLQIRLNELNNKHFKISDKYHEIDNNLNQERIKHHETSQQLLDQEAKNQQLANEIETWKNNYHQLSTENNEKQAKLETVKNNLNNLKLFYDRLNKEYRANLTNWDILVQNHNLVVSELNWVKEQRPDITLAEYNKIIAKNLQDKNFIKKIKKGKSIVCQLLKERKDELKQKSQNISQLDNKISDLTTELTNITNERNFLQTEKDNLTSSYQALQNDYTNLEVTSNTFQVERDNLQVELENKEKEIVQELINSLNLNLSQPTLPNLIVLIKELIAKPPITLVDNSRINVLEKQLDQAQKIITQLEEKNILIGEDLTTIKRIDLTRMEVDLGFKFSEEIREQLNSFTNYSQLIGFRHSLVKDYLVQEKQAIIQSHDKLINHTKNQRNILLFLLLSSLLIIGGLFTKLRKKESKKS